MPRGLRIDECQSRQVPIRSNVREFTEVKGAGRDIAGSSTGSKGLLGDPPLALTCIEAVSVRELPRNSILDAEFWQSGVQWGNKVMTSSQQQKCPRENAVLS
jgi:hypothetical protein